MSSVDVSGGITSTDPPSCRKTRGRAKPEKSAAGAPIWTFLTQFWISLASEAPQIWAASDGSPKTGGGQPK